MRKDVELRNISKYYGSNQVLKNINLEVYQGELLTLLGPSGCGKSTTLNLIAGFIEADEGELLIKERKMNRIPPYKRDLGMVFQTYSLFPHMTVYENIAFGLRLRKVGREEEKKKVNRMLELVKLTGMEDRYPRQLSGGQRQRVAIARALVVEPDLLLLDEPLSNLDAKLREELRAEIRRLHREIGVTTIFVTHDQEEALSLSDRIAVMKDGSIEQIGTPTEIYKSPRSEFVFQFIGKYNRLESRVVAVDSDGYQLETRGGLKVRVSRTENPFLNSGDQAKCYLRPEWIQIGSQLDALDNIFPAKIRQITYLGSAWELELKVGGETLMVQSPEIPADWQPEQEVQIGWKSTAGKLFKP